MRELDRFDEIKDKFKDLGVLAGADVVWLFVKIKDLQQKNEFLEKAHKTNIKISEDMKEERNQYKSLVESQTRVLEGFIGDIEDLKAKLDNVRDYVKVANETVCLDDHDEALYEAIDTLNYVIDHALEDFENNLKQ